MKQRHIILIGFIIIKFLLQYILIHPVYDLQRDEYLHLDLGQHLTWGYMSVPPVTALVSKIIYLFGNTVFWVKFFPALCGALTILFVWKATEALKGDIFALVLSATCILLSALLRLNTLYQPNSFDVLSWTAFYFIVIKYLTSHHPKWLYTGAVVLAFGFLSKYNIVFLVLGLSTALILTPERKIFTRKHLYGAAILGLVLISPNLIWQYTNGFPVVHHMKQLAETQLVNINRLDFLQSQIHFFFGGIAILIAAMYSLLTYAPFRPYKTFFWALPCTLLFFIVFKAKDYYAIGLYPIYMSFGAVYLSQTLDLGWKRYLKPVLLIFPLTIFLLSYNIAYPNKSPEYIIAHSASYKDLGLLRWEDGKDHVLPQDYADMLGWKELAGKIDAIYDTIPNAKQTLVLCDNYGQAGAINFYTKTGVKAVSFNADYINWFDLDINYTNLIRVKNESDNNKEFSVTSPYFKSSFIADSITNPYAREYGTHIYLFEGAKINVNQRIEEEIAKEKNWD